MARIETPMTAVSVFVDDDLKAHPGATQWRRSNHHTPPFTDAAVITIALLQGCRGGPTLGDLNRSSRSRRLHVVHRQDLSAACGRAIRG